MIELPFNQFELAQLELFLNREKEDNWVLVKIEEDKLYFENRPGKLYCYEVRLHIISKEWEANLLTADERKLRFIKEQEQAGWYFIGELQDWYIFRSLIERNPLQTKREWDKEYKMLRKQFLTQKLGSILPRGFILLIALLNVRILSPLDMIRSNFIIGMLLAIVMLIIWGILELKIWMNFKYRIYKCIRNGAKAKSNADMLKASKIRKRNRTGILGIAMLLFIGGIMLDGVFSKSWEIILMTILLTIRMIGVFLEQRRSKWAKTTEKTKRVIYSICIIGMIVVGLVYCISNIESSYQGKEALEIKERMKERSLVTLKTPYVGSALIELDVTEEERKTLFLKQYIQYSEWQGEHYICLNYYETWNPLWAPKLFNFILKVKKVDSNHGYQVIKPELYGADEVYIGEYGSSLYLRKGRHIIEIEYTSEGLDTSLWQSKIAHTNKGLA